VDDATGLYFPSPASPIWLGNTIALDTVADGSSHSPLDYNNAAQLVTALELVLGPAGDDATADKQAKSWDVKVKLNTERAGFGGSPNQNTQGTQGGDGGGCKCPPLCHVDIPGTPASEVVTTEKQFNANSDGGDSLPWDGILSNQSGGAAGSSHYYFHSNSPKEWSQVFATSPGTVYRVSGYVKDISSGEQFKIGFFTGTVGADGNDAQLISEHTLHSAPTGGTWTHFQVDVTAPALTAGWALGFVAVTVGISWDQITVASVVSDPGTGGIEGDVPEPVGSEGASGTSARAARCDHVHASDGVAEGHITFPRC
jgi:hypothetical protein